MMAMDDAMHSSYYSYRDFLFCGCDVMCEWGRWSWLIRSVSEGSGAQAVSHISLLYLYLYFLAEKQLRSIFRCHSRRRLSN